MELNDIFPMFGDVPVRYAALCRKIKLGSIMEGAGANKELGGQATTCAADLLLPVDGPDVIERID